MVRGKFKLVEVTSVSWGTGKKYKFYPEYDSSIAEDVKFSKATPQGELNMTVDNPAAQEQLVLGSFYYLDLTKVD